MADRPAFDRFPETLPGWDRRRFIQGAAAGTAVVALGGALWRLAADDLTRQARAEDRPDGRKRLPPGQRVLKKFRNMGGDEGPGDVKSFTLTVHGAVKKPFTVDYAQLLKLPQVEQAADVHCVTGWSCLGSLFRGVRISLLAEKARVSDKVRHVIFEGANGYTSNVPFKEAIVPGAMVTYRMNGKPFPLENGAPVRALVPDLYFWKSAKWVTGVRFVLEDEPGFWEVRGYHNHADPWKEERYG